MSADDYCAITLYVCTFFDKGSNDLADPVVDDTIEAA